MFEIERTDKGFKMGMRQSQKEMLQAAGADQVEIPPEFRSNS